MGVGALGQTLPRVGACGYLRARPAIIVSVTGIAHETYH